jgi:hypothetical protein
MKPNFALSLSFEGIKLLHRAAGGWREVGEVPVASDDLAGELAMLRKTAAGLAPEGVRTKLLIPAGQIKYLTIETPGLSEDARRKAAEDALDNATPYAVSDLAYDISVDGAQTHVAAVARETLAEAEAFAREHRFHPVSFVAVPDDAPYLGEPFFGMTQAAPGLLEPGEEVEPDGIAVVIVGAVTPEPVAVTPEPAAVAPEPVPVTPEPAKEPEPAAQPEPLMITTDDAPTEVSAAPQQHELPDVPTAALAEKADTTLNIEPDPAPQAAAETNTKAENEPQPKPAQDALQPKEAVPGPQEPAAPDVPADIPAVAATKDDLIGPAVKPTAEKQADKVTDAAPALRASQPEQTAPSPAPQTPTPQIAPPPEQSAKVAPLPALPTAPVSETVAADTGRAKLAATGFSTRRGGITSPPRPLGGAQRAAVPPPPDSSSLTQRAPVPDEPIAAQTIVAPLAPAPSAPAKAGFLSRRKPAAAAPAPAKVRVARAAPSGTEAERMTVFGARAEQVGGKPRFLGLVMTVILLVFLAGVAAWAAVFLDDGIAGLLGKDTTRTTASAPENQIDPEIIRTPDGATAQDAAPADSVQIAALDPVLSAEDTAILDAIQNQPSEPDTAVMTEADAAARYAVTGIWPLAPDTQLELPETTAEPVYQSGIDPVSSTSDAVALTAPGSFDTDIELAALVSPPPFGQVAETGSDGLIVPTEDGVVTPGGFTVFSVAPPLKPPTTLARLAAQPTVTAPEAVSPLAGQRPQNRPIGLSERTERAQLGGVSRVELAAFRPSLRPSSLQEQARAQEEAASEAATAAQQAEAASEEERAAAAAQAATAAATAALVVPRPTVGTTVAPAVIEATRLATAQSARPDTRPRNFDRIVRRAAPTPGPREEAAPEEEVEEQETRIAAASVAPRSVSPGLPSSASVARSATVANAINLRKVNLIGVYGKPSSRRALVRLSNGRYQKVSVGDRIDGGRVAAIGNSELRYTKGGRNVVLSMP